MQTVSQSKAKFYQEHKRQWSNCQLCPLSKDRQQVVLYRGTIPATVFYIGEGPGESEDKSGEAFKGPAGDLLNDLIESSLQRLRQQDYSTDNLTQCFSNLVGCIPWDIKELKDEDGTSFGTIRTGTREPKKAEVTACHSRLDDLIFNCRPKLIVCCGKAPLKYIHNYITRLDYEPVILGVQHPNAILRSDKDQRPVSEKRFVLKLELALRGILPKY